MRKTTQSTIATGLLTSSVLASVALWAQGNGASGESMMESHGKMEGATDFAEGETIG